MEEFTTSNKNNEKFNTGIWKKILKEFGFFKFLFVGGMIMGGFTGGLEIVQPKITKYVIDNFVNKGALEPTPIAVVAGPLATF